MKKLTWKKKKFGSDAIFWTAQVKTVGWEFSIEKNKNGNYEPFIYYGTGEDVPLLFKGQFCTSLKSAQDMCNQWLHDFIVNINRWY